MSRAGFVLVGGLSSRMGRNKALLPYRGATLLQYLAEIVREAAGSVDVIGDPLRYARFGYPVHPDLVAGCGPAGGIHTALSAGLAEWNLIVACDMPGITVALLQALLDRADTGGNCIIPLGPDGQPEPMCAVYHARCLPQIELAIREKRFRMRDLVYELEPVFVSAVDAARLVNINTPVDWAHVEEQAQ